MAKPAVLLVGSDKGGVGKTTVTRTLLDYFAAQKVTAHAFDTESPRGTLKRFHPDVTDIVDVTSVADQMRIFDTLNTWSMTVIDVRAGLLSPTLRSLRDMGFIDAARKGQINFGIFHILGPSMASLSEIGEMAPFVEEVNYFLVKNYINNTPFFAWDPATYNTYFKDTRNAHLLSIPHLNEMACEQVELASTPFVSFIANQKADGTGTARSYVLRGYVRHWLGNVWAEYDRVRLNEVMAVPVGAQAGH
jgi:hypothetical protein